LGRWKYFEEKGVEDIAAIRFIRASERAIDKLTLLKQGWPKGLKAIPEEKDSYEGLRDDFTHDFFAPFIVDDLIDDERWVKAIMQDESLREQTMNSINIKSKRLDECKELIKIRQ